MVTPARKSRDELKALYGDEYVAQYRSHPPQRLTRLLPYIVLRPTDDVVDFGCGNGILYDLIGHRVRRYTGVDFSESFIREAQNSVQGRAVNAEFVCSSISAFCANRPNSADVGFALDFAEHVYDDEWVEILRSIRSALKPGGTLYIHTPNGAFVPELLKARNFILHQQAEHVAVRTAAEHRRLLREAGFRVAAVRMLAHYLPILRPAHALSFLPGIGRYFGARLFIVAQA